MWEHGVRHLLYAFELYEMQLAANRYILHGHPLSALSWQIPDVQDFLQRWDLQKQSLDMCRFDMVSYDEYGVGLVKKPTGIITNAEYISARLCKRCTGGHRHVPLTNGRARQAQIDPEKMF